MDANDEDDLKAKLLSKKEEWNEKERKYLPEGKTPTFYNYLLAKGKKQCTLTRRGNDNFICSTRTVVSVLVVVLGWWW